MANLPGSAFAKGRDRIVRVASPGSTRKVATIASGVITPPTGLTYNFLKGATRAEFTPSPASQEFFLLGDSGWRDSVGVTQAGELACAAFFVNSLTAGAPNADIDTALGMVVEAEYNPDRELWVECFTYLGNDSTGKFKYHARMFQACITGVSEAAPSDGLIEYSWTFQSRGEIYSGIFDNGTSALTVY